jgi:hypothetical protein
MSEDTEYLPPHQREENQKEEKAFANVNLEDIEKRINELSDNKITNEKKLEMLDRIFDIRLDSRVRNRHSEDGIVEMVGIDYRGVQYLVRYKGHKLVWENDLTIKKVKFDNDSRESKIKSKTGIKTDFEVS